MSVRWSVRSVYFYLISLIMLITIVFSAGSFINAVIDMFDPEGPFGVDLPGNQLAAELALRKELRVRFPELSDEEIASLAREEHDAQVARKRASASHWRWRRLVQTAVLIVIAFPVYRYHWRAAKALSD